MGSRTDPRSSINEILIQTFRHTNEPLKGRYSQIKAVYNTIIYQETGYSTGYFNYCFDLDCFADIVYTQLYVHKLVEDAILTNEEKLKFKFYTKPTISLKKKRVRRFINHQFGEIKGLALSVKCTPTKLILK